MGQVSCWVGRCPFTNPHLWGPLWHHRYSTWSIDITPTIFLFLHSNISEHLNRSALLLPRNSVSSSKENTTLALIYSAIQLFSTALSYGLPLLQERTWLGGFTTFGWNGALHLYPWVTCRGLASRWCGLSPRGPGISRKLQFQILDL